MWIIIQNFFKSQYLAVLRWGAFALGAAGLYFKIKQDGKNEVKQEDLRKTVDEVKVAQQVQADVAKLSSDEYDRLRNEWTR